jgi:uncharacterized protein (TIGR02646 family)
MRPIRRRASPRAHDYSNYADAQVELIARLGPYCSYCERKIATNLAVEHIQPKGVPAYAHLIGRWENFLLACVNCNSTKGDKVVALSEVFLPDRDNTGAAFTYLPDGTVHPSEAVVVAGLEEIAKATLKLTGLDKQIVVAQDENGKQIAIDRVTQRLEAWLIAEEAKADVDSNPGNAAVRRGAVRTAKEGGFFSIWMTVFHQDIPMRQHLIDAFQGTRLSGCHHAVTSAHVSPHPNDDGLADGGKF